MSSNLRCANLYVTLQLANGEGDILSKASLNQQGFYVSASVYSSGYFSIISYLTINQVKCERFRSKICNIRILNILAYYLKPLRICGTEILAITECKQYLVPW